MNIKELKEYAYSKADLDLSRVEAPEIDMDMLKRRREEDPIFSEHFGKNYTRKILDKFEYQYKHKQNVIINTWGQPRSTKTYTNISLPAQTSYPITSIDTIFFKLEDINDYMPHLKECDTVLHDEHDEAFGVGTKRLELEYVRMIETMGKRRINFFITSPLPRARQHSYFLIQALRLIDYKMDISYNELTDNRFSTIGHLRVINPMILNRKLVDEYEKKKDAFLDTVQKKKSSDYLSEMAYAVIDSEEFKYLEDLYKSKAKKKKKDFIGMPFKAIIEVINEKHPELRRNIECRTIAEKIIHSKIIKREWLPRG